MLNFDLGKYSYPSHRNVVFGRAGMACSTVPLVSQVGIDIMQKGGNAVDAAIAMAATLPLTEPTGNGLGSDCFVLVYSAKDKKLYGLDGSGVAPMALSAQKVKDAGFTEVPKDGWMATMVPGAPSAWAMLRERFGSKSMVHLLAPAITYACLGFNVPVNVAPQWEREVKRFMPYKDEKAYEYFFKYYTKDGKAYKAGEVFSHPDYARTLKSLAETNCASYYRGEIMEKIVEFSDKTGGYFAKSDFENYSARWVEPITINYKGYDVYEMPPNGHGITALMALNILKEMELSENRENALTYHKTIEAVKLAFADAKKFVADPRYMKTKVEDMLSDDYAALRRSLIGDTALYPEAGDPSCGGTVYFSTADEEGNMVSFIQSNYCSFGSGICVEGTGISLQNRGANFSLDPSSDNYLEGGKKSYHTIIPGFLAKDGKPIGPFGVMGGFMQPQGHVQVIVNTIDYNMNPQECLDAPRFQWIGDKQVQLEAQVDNEIAKKLAEMGHEIEVVDNNLSMGRGQIIWRMEDGTYIGGTEPRADGAIAAF